jgi:hypothetical protein
MDALFVFGMLAVAAGLGLATAGVGRAVVAARTAGVTAEATISAARPSFRQQLP